MVQPIDEEKSGKFQFIYNEVRKVIPYLDHLMNTFAESVYSEQKLEMLCLDNTNVVSKKIDFNPAGSWKDMVQTAPPKSQVRIFEKTGVKYNYDFRRVLDEARGSFICNNMEEVNGVYYTFAKFLEARGCRILRVKNRFMQSCGKSDYADILFNAEINDTDKTPDEFKGKFLSGTIVEIQIHIKAFKNIKKTNHKIYGKFRAIPGLGEAVAKLAITENMQDTEQLLYGCTECKATGSKNNCDEPERQVSDGKCPKDNCDGDWLEKKLALMRSDSLRSLSKEKFDAFKENWMNIDLSDLNLADTEDDPDFDSLDVHDDSEAPDRTAIQRMGELTFE